jgi:hypothetical protein
MALQQLRNDVVPEHPGRTCCAWRATCPSMFDERSRHAELTATGRGSRRMWTGWPQSWSGRGGHDGDGWSGADGGGVGEVRRLPTIQEYFINGRIWIRDRALASNR